MIDSLASPGGAERLAVENVVRLDPEHFDRTLCITRWRDGDGRNETTAALLARLEGAGVRVVKLRRGSRGAVWAWLPLVRLLRRERVDVLHAHLFGSNLWASILGRLTGVPVVVAHEHMWAYNTANRLRPVLDREVIGRLADAFVAVSDNGRRQMVDVERVNPEKIVLIRNGIAGFAVGNRERVRAELGIGTRATVVGSVGRLRPEKAYEVLIAATPPLREEFGELAVVIVGDGPGEADLRAQIAEFGLGGIVHLTGARDDVPDLLGALDLAVCCSDFEGGPLSVMEYMEAALPVVATDVGGIGELVVDGESGVLVPPRDPAALAAAVATLLRDPELRHRLGDRGRELRRERADLGVWIGEIEALYRSLLAQQAEAKERRR